jgi:hypothetical protein
LTTAIDRFFNVVMAEKRYGACEFDPSHSCRANGHQE